VIWNWEFAASCLPIILNALWATVSATVVAFMIAMIAGLVLAILRRSKIKLISWTVIGFIEFIRGTPLLVQLFFIFYVLPSFGITLTTFTAGVIGLGIHYSTFCSEIYRSGIDSVPKGQWEASTALNFTPTQKWLKIILPQAIPPIIPMLGNYLVVMFKEVPILSAIAYVDMLQTAKIIGSTTFRYLEPITIVGLLFLILSIFSSMLVRRLERRLNHRGIRVKDKSAGKGVTI
jgi:polar amino acid transport system permease protein